MVTSVSCNQVYDYSSGLPKLKDSTGFLTENRTNYSYDNLIKRYNNNVVDETYIQERSDYAENRMNISSSIIFHDMIAKSQESENSDSENYSNADTTEQTTSSDVKTGTTKTKKAA